MSIKSVNGKAKFIGCFCITFIGFPLKDQSLLDHTNLIFPREYEKNDKAILKHLQ